MLEFDGLVIETDPFGYLTDPSQWNEKLAYYLAFQEHIQLTEEHWEIIFFIREFYSAYHISPAMRLLVKAVKQKYGDGKGNSRYLYALFPKGPAKQATKIAGLPKPIRCI